MQEENQDLGSKGRSFAVASRPERSHEPERVSGATADRESEDAYALALEALGRLFLEQQARIAAEAEAARAAAEESDFRDYKEISRAATRAAQVSWEADDQIAGLKQRMHQIYQERVVEPIMEIRRLAAKMEERNRDRFRRRVGDRH